MRLLPLALCSLALSTVASARAWGAEVDARPPDRLTLTGNASRFRETQDEGGGGSINWLHYFTPDAVFGVGAEHQFIEEANWTFGAIRGALSRGEPASRFTVFGEVQYGDGDDNGRDFNHEVWVLGVSQALTGRLSVQLEARGIDIDRSHGNLPKLGVTYIWTPRLVTNVSYAHSVGGNLGTELAAGRIDYYGQYFNLMAGGAWGTADPIVVNLEPGLILPDQDMKQGFFGIGRAFGRSELLLLGDYLRISGNDRMTVTLGFTVHLGSRGRSP